MVSIGTAGQPVAMRWRWRGVAAVAARRQPAAGRASAAGPQPLASAAHRCYTFPEPEPQINKYRWLLLVFWSLEGLESLLLWFDWCLGCDHVRGELGVGVRGCHHHFGGGSSICVGEAALCRLHKKGVAGASPRLRPPETGAKALGRPGGRARWAAPIPTARGHRSRNRKETASAPHTWRTTAPSLPTCWVRWG
eukprot:SAG25_NODE_4_length_30349_cov_110.018280_19_plen_194_part_00